MSEQIGRPPSLGKHKTRKRVGWLLAVSAVAVGITGGIAYATIPDENGAIHGCWNKGSGNLRVVDAPAESCGPAENALDWNQTGPRGPQGPPGVAGYEVVTGNTAENAQPYKELGVPCPPGKTVIGGGAIVFVRTSGQFPQLVSSGIINGAWYAEAQDSAGFNSPWWLRVQAICASVQ